jgi:general stress protein CsbA
VGFALRIKYFTLVVLVVMVIIFATSATIGWLKKTLVLIVDVMK